MADGAGAVITAAARGAALGLVVAIVIASCAQRVGPTPSSTHDPPRGGTLRIAIAHDDPPPSALASTSPERNTNALDPHYLTWNDALELHRCCLSRTLVSYAGLATAEGGTILLPDLAEGLPEVSEDGLTWTFRIRPGIRYAPPLAHVEVTAADFVRALLRVLPSQVDDPTAFATLTQLGIRGVDDYVSGRADTVAGIEVPDDRTLRLRLDRPAGDLPSRFALPDTAPIPPSPDDPAARLGIATGHDADFGRFFVSTGPYMVEGANAIDFGRTASERTPPPGYVPGHSLILVRNPSWVSVLDQIRPALVDRIELAIGGTPEDLAARVDSGDLDLVFSAGAPPQAPIDQIVRYGNDPTLGQVHRHLRDIIRYVEFNTALPPFDDVEVRKAVNLAIDKARLIDPETGVPMGHLVLDSIEEDLLRGYAPHGRPDGRADREAAREAIRRSRYDRDGDGRCDDPSCSGIRMLTFFRFTEAQAASIVADLEAIGLSVVAEPDDGFDGLDPWRDPSTRAGLYAGGPWLKDTLNAAPFYRAIFHSAWSMTPERTNGHLVGASPERLAAWGYPTTTRTLNVDDRIDDCSAHADGTVQVQCWADLDLYMMEKVVPWVPLFVESHVRTTGPRVVGYSFDQFAAQPALDRIALAPGP